jgi:hypothetical protein
MKFVKVLAAVAFAVALSASLAIAAEGDKKKAPPGKLGGCCAKAAKDGKACAHACCVEAAKAGKNCEKCGGTNEEKKK